jgi:hypothetical protein
MATWNVDENGNSEMDWLATPMSQWPAKHPFKRIATHTPVQIINYRGALHHIRTGPSQITLEMEDGTIIHKEQENVE